MTTESYISKRKSSTRKRPQGLLFAEDFTYNEELELYLPTGDEINSDGDNQSFLILSDDNRSPIQVGKERIEKRERMINGRMRSYHIADKINLSVSWSNLPSRSFGMNPNFASGIEYSIIAVASTDDGQKIQFTTATSNNFYVGARVQLTGVAGITEPQRVTDVEGDTFKILGTGTAVLNNAKAKVVEGQAQGLLLEVERSDDPNTPDIVESNIEIKSSGSRFYKDQQYTTDGGAGGNDLLTWYENHPGSFYVLLAYDKYEDFSSDKYSKLGRYNQAVEVYFSDFSYTIEKRGQLSHDFWNVSFSLEEV
jgi:hypothetical protein